MAGYSGTPLAKKLGIRAGSRVVVINAPLNYAALLEPVPDGVHFDAKMSDTTDIVHAFCMRRTELEAGLQRWRHQIRADAMVWVSWPKKAAKLPTDITEDTIRTVALPLGFIDVKVCAVDEVWSGLKLVVRKALR
jgi:hypothetical protein